MPQATVRWINGLNFVGIDSDNHSVVLSGEKNGIGVKPSQMLLVALASCSGVDVVEILAKKRTPVTMLEIVIDGQRAEQAPWAYQTIHVHYRLSGKGLSPAGVEQAIRLSQEKYCSVAATVRGVASIQFDYEIVAEA